MVLYIIGLGLGDEDDITVKGLKLVRGADLVFLEAYTSVLGSCSTRDEIDDYKTRLEKVYGKSIQIADRHLVESEADDKIIEAAIERKVAFLVVGDPVCATTHTDLVLRAKQRQVKIELIQNASIMGAAGACGLQLYNFGQTVSIPFFRENWRPASFYPKIRYNRQGGLHTLCLLDIKVKEPDYDAMMKSGFKTEKYLPPRFMTIATAAEQLMEVVAAEAAEVNNGDDEAAYDGNATLCVGLARMGQPSQCIAAGTLRELQEHDFGGPLHSLIICGELHELELEVLKEYIVEGSTYQLQTHHREEQDELR